MKPFDRAGQTAEWVNTSTESSQAARLPGSHWECAE